MLEGRLKFTLDPSQTLAHVSVAPNSVTEKQVVDPECLPVSIHLHQHLGANWEKLMFNTCDIAVL